MHHLHLHSLSTDFALHQDPKQLTQVMHQLHLHSLSTDSVHHQDSDLSSECFLVSFTSHPLIFLGFRFLAGRACDTKFIEALEEFLAPLVPLFLVGSDLRRVLVQ